MLYNCEVQLDKGPDRFESDEAQLQKLKQLCTGDNCFVDPHEVFDTSLCPGKRLTVTLR